MAEAGAERGQQRPWTGWLTSIFSRRRLEAVDQPVPVAEAEGGQPPGDAAVEANPPPGEAAGDQGLRSPPVLHRKSAAAFATPGDWRSRMWARSSSFDDNAEPPEQPEKKRPRLGDEKCCWLCLGEEGDADGGEERCGTVVRHASDLRKSSKPWESCPCCLQPYQGTLALDMAHALNSFASEKYPGPSDAWKHIGSLSLSCSIFIDEGLWKLAKLNAELSLLAIKLQRAEPGFNRNSSLTRELREFEALAYSSLGHASFARGAGTDESKRKAVSHFERSRALYRAIGHKGEESDAERQIAIVKAEMEGQYVVLKRELLEVAKVHYERDVAKFGRESAAAIRSGIIYVERLYHCGSRGVPFFLWYAKSSLEAQRLATKLAGACKQLHGPGHRLTQKIEGVLREYKRRYAHIEGELYEALRYEDDGKTCIVQKACEEPGDEMDWPIRIPTNQIRPMVGTPVVCQGLREATRYNGKIGFVAEPFDELTGCCKVRFEEKILKPCPVSHEHLRILFDLPSK